MHPATRPLVLTKTTMGRNHVRDFFVWLLTGRFARPNGV